MSFVESLLGHSVLALVVDEVSPRPQNGSKSGPVPRIAGLNQLLASLMPSHIGTYGGQTVVYRRPSFPLCTLPRPH
ncbi:hypothetical protein DPEC_G00007960 [Dallia pectoralis]|uniref:Uncharacterized protein n=1 Tax=Dallia pectoralis TaxID=75939 RepID=A0ACC2HM07_DALPE|nr:hypothetical protein DPEC_G00007960 [Dallia pectoralis]